MRIKQTIFLVLSVLLALGIGVIGFLFGPEVGKYSNSEVIASTETTVLNSAPSSFITTVFAPAENYKNFFTNIQPVIIPDGSVKSVIIPHHLVAGEYIASIFQGVKKIQPRVVVVIGPNHYQVGDALVATSLSSWDTGFGTLNADRQIIQSLLDSNLVGLDDNALVNEYSVGAVVPFVKNTWPQARVVPLVVKNIKNDEMFDGLAAKLYEVLPENSLVVASVDFSHYLPKEISAFHDDLSLNVLETGDISRVRKMEIDSQNSIRVLLRYNQIAGAKKFTVAFHTNSADLLSTNSTSENTSHIMGYFSQKENDVRPTVTLQLFGDMMLERSVEANFGDRGLDYVFEKIKGQDNRFFFGADLFVANLEGPFAPFRIDTSKSIAFRFDPKLAAQLKRYNFSAFSLANNHALDMGEKNYDFTKKILADNGLAYFGHQSKEGVDYTWIAGEKEGLSEKVAFIGINSTDHLVNKEKIKEAIVDAQQQARYVVAYIHWGNEYERLSHVNQQSFGRWLVDNGVTAVIGMHPHVIQEMELYQSSPIFYSLGNFVFDQYFSRDTQEGISVGLDLQDGKVKRVYVFPFYSVKSQNILMGQSAQAEFFQRWNMNSRLDGKVFENNKIDIN